MKKIFFLTSVLIAAFCSLCGSNTLAEPQAPSEAKKTEVVIIGTIHDRHYESSKYTPEVLKEIILALKPDAILNELPLSQVDSDGRPLSRHYFQSPECWAADTVATELGVKQIPFDRPDREENFKKTKWFKRNKNLNKRVMKWIQEIKENNPESSDHKMIQLLENACIAEAHMFSNAGPEIINSEAHDSVIRIKKLCSDYFFPTMLKKYTGYETLIEESHFFRDQWHERNKIMAQNIVKAAKQYPGKCLVVQTGATHRYILRDLLKNEDSVDVKEYWELIDFDLEKCLKSITEYIPDVGIAADGLSQEEASQKIARGYWQAVIKGDWKLVDKLQPPIGDMNWKEKYNKNMPVELIEVKQAYWPPNGNCSGPVAPCIVKFADGRIFEIKMVPQFRKIRGKTLCYIIATWGKAEEVKKP